MNKPSIDRDEVIMKLTDIYHQLEEVESLLDSNISVKTNGQIHSFKKLRNISDRISIIEQNEFFLNKTCVPKKTIGLEHQKKIKLTLGY